MKSPNQALQRTPGFGVQLPGAAPIRPAQSRAVLPAMKPGTARAFALRRRAHSRAPGPESLSLGSLGVATSTVRTRLFNLLLLVAFPAWLAAGSVLPENITAGKLLPNSTSPDGKFCLLLLDFFHSDTTQTSVIFATTDRSKNLGYAPVLTVWISGIPYIHTNRTTIIWASDSSRVAIHESLRGKKNSTLEIRRLVGGQFEPVTVPDLLLTACQQWGISRERVVSSGQRPTRWAADDIITVEVSAMLKEGGQRTATLQLNAPKDGAATIKPK